MNFDIMNAISTVGFPIAVAVWAMYSSRKDKEWLQDTLSVQITNLVNAIGEMTQAVDEVKDMVERSRNG